MYEFILIKVYINTINVKVYVLVGCDLFTQKLLDRQRRNLYSWIPGIINRLRFIPIFSQVRGIRAG